MDRRRFLASVGVTGAAGVAGCLSRNSNQPIFQVRRKGFERLTDDGYEPVTVRGLNIGMAKPGHFPGAAAITRNEYDRWISDIGAIANVIRTYTIHPPEFYHALAAYNADTTDPLYLLQGTWVPHEPLVTADDVTSLSDTVDQELQRTVDVVHGDTTLPNRPGHAGGIYDADIHEWLLGYLFGIEWPPSVIKATNQAIDTGTYSGSYIQSDGSAFERWLAERLDGAVEHETTNHDWQAPVGFVNWVTTDPLDHPYEPFVDEDSVTVDPDTVTTTDEFDPGTFAAYHVYPYYPDLLNETPDYVEFTDHRGEPNSYAGYLNDLVSVTSHPLLIAEFGVPSSRGIAHRDVHGRHQGRHTEQSQGEIVAAMYEDIVRAGTAGGVAFAWQDEWFKRTWNLDARSVPGRRPYWSNIETPEQRFGLLAFEPENAVSLSGNRSDWGDATVIKPQTTAEVPADHQLAEFRISHSLEGLEMRVTLGDAADPMDWSRLNLILTVGLRGEETPLPLNADATATCDFVVHLSGPATSRLLVQSSFDAFAREFGSQAGLPVQDYRDGAAGFVPVREPINRGYTVPATGDAVPFEAVETGHLIYGNGEPSSSNYNSLTDVHVSPADRTVEVRLPWVLLNVADPSTKQRIASDWSDGLEKTSFETMTVGAATYRPTTDGQQAQATDGTTNLIDALPGRDGATLNTATYNWEQWNQPSYTERLKQSYDVLQNLWS